MKHTRIYQLLETAYNLGAERHDPVMGRHDTRQRLTELVRQQEAPLDWAEAERISDVEEVDEAFRDFTDDPTADGATILVQRVIAAYLKG